MSELVLFETGSVKFALDRKCIDHIGAMPAGLMVAMGRIQRQAIEYLGDTLLVIDLATFLERESTSPPSPAAKMIMVKGSPALAFWADDVRGSSTASAEQMAELPSVFTGRARACFPRVLRLKDQIALVVDLAAVAALASLEQCAPASASTHRIQPEDAADDRGVYFVEERINSDSLVEPPEGDTLETVVAQKLQQIIGRRVKQAVAKTMADALDRDGFKYNFS